MSNKTSHSRKTSTSGITRRKLYVAMLAASQLMAAGEAWAAPDGGKVVGGAGTIDQSGLDTTIHQTTERMAIDWQSFDVKANEHVQFIQPKTTSIALNRVVSNKGSEILGRIDANGQVFLINPNGVVFGKGSQINVGGIIASGLNIDPNDFMNGQYTLTALEGTEGKVINSGIINASTGGSVTLVGQQVKNEGLISANLGAVSLAAGKEAVVTFDKAGLVGIKVTKEVLQKDLGVDAAVLNSGEINAEGGKILITASVSQDIFSEAVNNGGMNKASSVVVHEDGSFTLGAGSDVVNTGSINVSKESGDAGQIVVLGNNITNSGNIHADAITGTAGNIELHSTDTTSLEQNAKVTAKTSTHGVGGDVKVLGNKVGLFDNAEVNTSGANGGGQVLIGGDQTGANIKIRNADFIYLGENTTVKTDGLLNGDGGKLITFSSDTARIYGSLSARGGNENGNGGFIETSGLKGFEIFNAPDVGAIKGKSGTWLIDPYNIEITNPSPDKPKLSDHNNTNISTATSGNNPKNTAYTSNDNSAELDVFILEAALEKNATVIVRTSDPAGDNGKEVGNITLSGILEYDFTGNYNSNNPGNNNGHESATLRFEASNNIIIKNNIVRDITDLNNGNATILTGNKLNVELFAKGDITFATGTKIETQGGNFTASSTNFDSSSATISTIREANTTVIDNKGAIKVLTNGVADTNGSVSIFANGEVNFGLVDTNNLTVTGDSNRNLTESTHTITKSNVSVIQSNFLTVRGDATFDVGTGDITLTNVGNDFWNNVLIKSANDVSLVDTKAIKIGASTVSGNFSLTAGGNVSQSDALIVKGTTTLSAVGKNVDLSNQENDFQSTVSTAISSSVGSLNIATKNDLNLGTIIIKSKDTATNNEFKAGSTGTILLNGNIINTSTNGTAGKITFDNNVSLKNNVTISGADITFAKALDSDTQKNLTLSGNTINFNDIGSSNHVGGLTITQAKDVTAGKINASGAVSVTATGSVNLGDIDTHTESTTAGVGNNGGAVTITGKTITLNSINTSGANGTFVTDAQLNQVQNSGGNAGAVTVTASGTDANITLKGDIVTKDGNGTVGPTVAQIKLGSKGIIDLSSADFFTSLVSFSGNGAGYTLKGFKTNDTWKITSGNAGTISNTVTDTVTIVKQVLFTGFANLTGADGTDNFIIGAAGSVEAIDGGAGSNTITGNDASSTWSIKDGSASNLVTTVGAVSTTNVASFSNIQNLVGGSGKNTFDFSLQTAASTFTYNVKGGTDAAAANTLIGRNSSTTWSLPDSGNNTLASTSNNAIYVNSFENIQTLQGGNSSGFSGDIFIINKAFAGQINGGAGADTFNVNAVVDGISGGAGDDKFFINLATTGKLMGGAGNDTFTIKSQIGEVFGEEGNDTFILSNAAATATIHGGTTAGEQNSIVASDSVNEWEVTSANTGKLTSTDASLIKHATVFDGIQQLQGGTKVDTFIFTKNDSVNGIGINGGEGEDNTLDWSRITTATELKLGVAINGISNVSTVLGNKDASFTLNAGDNDNTWQITGDYSGKVTSGNNTINFSGFSNLVGGIGKDTFKFDNASSIIKADAGGGAGINTLDLSNISKDSTLLMSESLLGIKNLTKVVGNSNFAFTLQAGDDVNIWTINGVNSGSVIASANNKIDFVNFKNLVGGKNTNIFVFENSGSIVSGKSTGINTLDLQKINADMTVTLNGFAIMNIENVSSITGNINKDFTLSAGTGQTPNTWTINGANKGTLQNDVIKSVEFINFKHLVGGTGVDNFTLSLGGSVNSLDGGLGDGKNTLTDTRNAATTIWRIDSGNNSIDGVITSFSNIQAIQAGSGADTFKINADFVGGSINAGNGANQFEINAVINSLIGGDNDDTFTFGSINNTKGKVDSLVGGGGNNVLFGLQDESQNTWSITGANAGNIVDSNNNRYVTFTDIKTLHGGKNKDIFKISGVAGDLFGGSGDDSFEITANGSISSIHGESGDNTLKASDLVNNQWLVTGINSGVLNGVQFDGVQHLVGGALQDDFKIDTVGKINSIDGGVTTANHPDTYNTLSGRVNTNNTWTMTSLAQTSNASNVADTVYVDAFSNIQTLIGGDLKDIFNINQNFSGNIRGGAGDDEFTISATATGILSGEAGNDKFTFSGAGRAITIDGGNVAANENNIIQGEDVENTWTLSANNGGTYKLTLASTNKTQDISFANIQTLQGGLQADIFNINVDFLGNIYGGRGNDIFNINAAAGQLFGQAGSDKFYFTAEATDSVLHPGTKINVGSAKNIDGGVAETVNGIKDVNTIYGRNTDTRWTLLPATATDTAVSTLTSIIKDEPVTVYVTNFTNIDTLQGGSARDVFDIRIDFTGHNIDCGAGVCSTTIGDKGGTYIGSDDDDEFILLPGASANLIDGAGGTNTLYGLNTTNKWVVNSKYSGYIINEDVADGTPDKTYVKLFKNIQSLVGNDKDDEFVIDAAMDEISGGLGNDKFTINAVVGKIHGDAGNDVFTFKANGAIRLANGDAGILDGGDGENTLIGRDTANTWILGGINDGKVQDDTNQTGYAFFQSIQVIQGKADTLMGANLDNNWIINAQDAGSISNANQTLNFSGIKNLTGNRAIDTFTFMQNGSVSGVINGGTSIAGAIGGVQDILNVEQLTQGVAINLGNTAITNPQAPVVLTVKNIESIKATADSSKNFLYGSSDLASYTWIIDGISKGSVAATDSTSVETKTTFENFGHVLGGSKSDQFQVSNNGSIADIDGGDGEDYLDYSTKTLVNINLGSSGSIGSTNIKSIEGIKGNNDGHLNTAFNSTISADGGNTWSITGTNSGQITLNGKTVSFENFNIINGGSGDDKFELGAQGQLIGTINGGGGNNIFNASASTLQQIVAIDGTAAKQTNVSNIKNIIGNAATDSRLIGADQSNDWKIGTNASGTINKSGTTNNEITFSGFSRLVGGSQKDLFTINNADGIKVLLDGGSANGTDDEVNLSTATQDVIVGVGEQAKADIKIINISKLNANPNNNNTLVSNDTSNNTWNIVDKNKGTLNTQLTFAGFANLLGGQGQDVFNFSGALAAITGVIDGGEGLDSLNLNDAGRDLSVHIVNPNKAVSSSDVNIINIESVDASADHINNLIASDTNNQWSITAKNSGSLVNETSTINFTNFTNLIGGAGNDNFVFDALGSLAGYIDGGAGDTAKDSVDVSKVSHATVLLGDDGAGYRNVENYIGNNVDSILTGDKNDNTWTLAAAQNSGDINNKIFFTGFATLVGGAGNDSFNLLQGELSGSIFGGAGNDTFTVGAGTVLGGLNGDAGDDILKINIASDSAAQTTFTGGSGTNSINIAGGDTNYTATHTSTANAGGTLNYTSQDNKVFTILYSDVAAIRDDLIANTLTLNNTFDPDVFSFSNNAYTLNHSSVISYSNKTNLIVAGAADDQVSIEGEVNNVQSLTIQNASASSTLAGLIRVKDLNLNNVGTIGSVANRVNISADNLSVTGAIGDVYLKEENSLVINGFSNNQRFDLLLGGDLTSSKELTSFGDIILDSSANITLTQDNILSGNIAASAIGDIKLRNLGAINFDNVKAQNLDVNSTGAINGNGVMNIAGRATFASGDNIVLMNAANAFNELTIGSAINTSITDKDLLILTGATSSGLLDIHSQGLNVKGVINIADLSVDAGQKAAALDTDILATSSININATGITTSGKLTAADINLNSLTGDILLSGVLDTSSKQAITVTGNNITQNGKISSGGDTNIHATGNFIQSADIESTTNIIVASDRDLTMNANTTSKGENVNYSAGGAMNLLGNIIASNGTIKMTAGNTITLNGNSTASSGVNITSTNGDVQQRAQINNQQGDIVVFAGGNIVMNSDGVSTAENGNINYAAQNIALNVLDAKSGTVLLTATKGAVTDNNGSTTNIIAKGLDVVAATGIGADDALETSVSTLALSNALGNIGIVNSQAVSVSQLRTNGDINFVNLSGNVLLGNQPAVGAGETPNRPVTDTTYQTNNLIIKVNSGNLLASGAKSIDHPEITANNTALIVSGTIGVVSRPLVIDSNSVAVTSRRTWKPIFATPGTIYTDIAGSSASASDITATSHEQLVQVETLAEVNPAVFTGVRNYVYDDVAILLPEDQRYEDSEK